MTTTSVVSSQRRTGSPSGSLDLSTDAVEAVSLGFAPARPSPGLVLKYGLDLLASALLVAVCSPVFLVVSLAIKLTSPGPVFFVQRRVGKDGKVFSFFKFRTMKHNSDDSVHRDFTREFICGGQNGNGNGHGNGNGNGNGNANGNGKVYKLTRDPRVTSVGQFLRRTSLDELPQLFNVLRGDMSLVGPRPPVLYEIEHYQEWHKRRLAIRPGLTGLWQVSGRSSVPFDEMVLLDLYYIEHRSLWMDVQIIAKTLPVMLSGSGAY